MKKDQSLHKTIYRSPIGNFLLVASDKELHILEFFDGEREVPEVPENEILKMTRRQLDEYFAGKRKQFEIPLFTEGTEFQKKVWDALRTIGYGETLSYEGLAEKINNGKAVRAVGTANGKNPLAVIIPCHRVINKSGKLGGYGGGLWRKEKLLRLEGMNI